MRILMLYFNWIYPILSFLYVIYILKIETFHIHISLLSLWNPVCISHQQRISVQTSHILSVSSPPVAGGHQSGGEWPLASKPQSGLSGSSAFYLPSSLFARSYFPFFLLCHVPLTFLSFCCAMCLLLLVTPNSLVQASLLYASSILTWQ